MKITAALITALLLSLVVLSGCAKQAPAQAQNEATPTQTATAEQVASEASSQIVPENSEVEIGEMI